MSDKKSEIKYFQDKYRRLYTHPNYARSGGFFRTKKRKQLLNISGKSGRGMSKSDFWYDVRETVKTGLIDLQLFIDSANTNNLNRVINPESLIGILQSLFYKSQAETNKAKIATKNMRFRNVKWRSSARRDQFRSLTHILVGIVVPS